MIKTFSATALILFLFSHSLHAQSRCSGNSCTTSELLGQLNTVTTAVPFLMIAPDSRGGGMADIGCASLPDANSIHYNPSKLGFIENDKKMGFSISYTPWLRALVPDINLAYLSGFYKTKKGTFGTSLRYFSLGNITFTDVVGNVTGNFTPNEFAIDGSYGMKLSDRFSAGGAVRFIYSNLTGGITVQGASSHAGTAVGVDLSGYYKNNDIEVGGKKSIAIGGFNISNIGSKISYTNTGRKDFIPINMKLGGALYIDVDQYNRIGILTDINKLLVPTPPVYATNPTTGATIYDPTTGKPVIAAGKDNDVSVVKGIFQSFSDAPGGFQEELREFTESGGIEYWYDKQFAFRAGYFNEAKTKGNRKFFTVGVGLRYNVFGLDFAYLIPTEQRNPLQNTLRFTLLFDLAAFKGQNKDSGTTPQN